MPRELKPCGTVAAYRRGCRCEQCRAANASSMRAYTARRNAEGRPRARPSQARPPRFFCADCGTPVRAGRPGADGNRRCRPCGRKHSENTRRAKTPPAQSAFEKRWAALEKRASTTATGTRSHLPRFHVVVCEWCDEVFIHDAKVTGVISKRCSPRCTKKIGRHKQRLKHGRFSVPLSVRTDVYERDGWTCQLCGRPVDPDLDPNDPMGATLDHIICQSWADEPDHTPSNLRLAHRLCNSMRGDETWDYDMAATSVA